MDILSLAGLVLGAISIVVGSILKGAGVKGLVGGAAFMIVVVGTIAAILLQTPMSTFRRALRMALWVWKPPVNDSAALIAKIVEWSNLARKQGLLALEPAIEQEADGFLKKGLQSLVDGSEPASMRRAMEIELATSEHADLSAAKVFEGMGIYAPTLGIIGAVLGLMAVMQNLADPSKLGAGIAAAFTATVYGIGLANLFLLPAAAKLKGIVAEQAQLREMVIEGMVSIAQGDNPRTIESKLQGYLQ